MSINKTQPSFYTSLISFFTVVLIVFKLANVIDWNWWLVFSPVLVNFFFAGLAIILGVLFALIEFYFTKND